MYDYAVWTLLDRCIINKEPSFEKVIIFNEINYKSYTGAQTFHEIMYTFKNIPIDYKTHMIIDIKAVKFKKNGATSIFDYAWTVFPVFTVLDGEEKKSKVEQYVRSGPYMMPLFEGSVRPDIADELKTQNDIWAYLIKEDKAKVSPVQFLGNSGVVIKCVDNQRENHYLEYMDWERFDYGFWPKKRGSYAFDDKAIMKTSKHNQIISLLPAGKSSEDASEEIDALLKTVYKIPL